LLRTLEGVDIADEGTSMNQRDRDLVVVRGLRKGLITVGVLSSLGFATVAALTTGSTSAAGGSASTQPSTSDHHRAHHGFPTRTRVREPGEEAGSGSGDDAQPTRPQRQQLQSRPAPGPALQAGSGGAPQATTSGSWPPPR
jgi:hypothetical protein